MPRPKRKRTNNDSKDSGERISKRQRTRNGAKLEDPTFKLTFLDLPTDTKRAIMEYLTELDLYRLLVTSKDCASVAKLTLPRVHEEKRRIRFASVHQSSFGNNITEIQQTIATLKRQFADAEFEAKRLKENLDNATDSLLDYLKNSEDHSLLERFCIWAESDVPKKFYKMKPDLQPEGMADFWNLFERKYGCYEETDKIDFWWVLDMMCDMFKVELHIDNRECKGNKRNVDIFLKYIEQIMLHNFGGAYYLYLLE